MEENLEKYNNYEETEREYNEQFMEKLTEWFHYNCSSVWEANSNILIEKIKRIEWSKVLMKGIKIAGIVVSICFPEIAPFIAIAEIVLSGGVRIYKKLERNEKINWFEELLDAGLDTVLILSKTKGMDKLAGKLKKFIGDKMKCGKGLGQLGKNMSKFLRRINDALEKNLGGKMIKNIGKGIVKDVINRREEYKSALQEIGKDLIKGKNPSEKIKKLIIDSAYSGFYEESIKYIFEKTGNKKALNKKFIKGAIKTIGNITKDVLLKNKDLLTSIKHNGYRILKDHLKKWVNNKTKDNQVLKTFIEGIDKTVDSLVYDLLDNKEQFLTTNGELNYNLIDKFFKDLVSNEKNVFEKYFVDKLKAKLIKEIKNAKKNNKQK
jgi:hypothetical protein